LISLRTIKNAKFETIKCIICDANDAELIYRGMGENGFEVHECICKQCGFVYLNPRWDEDTYLQFYETTYDKYWRKNVPDIPPERNGTSYYLLYQRWMKYFPDFKPSYILDIGCGNGKKLAYIMQQFDAKYFGIEPSIASKPDIVNKGIHFIANDVNSDWDEDLENKFDFIIMRRTLEHFLNPIKVLTKARNVISDNGLLYIAVPDALCKSNTLIGHNFTIVHPYFFSEYSLNNLLQKCGFEIVKIVNGNKSVNNELFVFAKLANNKISQINYRTEDYEKTKSVFSTILKAELSLKMKTKRFIKIVRMSIVRFKKMFHLKPIFQKKHQLLKED